MPSPRVYPDRFAKRARKYREAGNSREATVALLKQEFPELAGRITVKSITDLLSRAAYRKACQFVDKQKQTKITHWVELDEGTKQEVYTRARQYHSQRYRWSAIMEALIKDYPDIKLPPAGNFSNWVFKKTEPIESVKALAKAPAKAPANDFTLTITNCGSMQFQKSISASEAKQIIGTALELRNDS